MKLEYLTIALAKGRLSKEVHRILQELKLSKEVNLDSRKLIFTDDINNVQYIYVKPSDVVTYVEKGVADLGIVGKDTILEQNGEVYEILDMNISKCKISIAGLKGQRLSKKDEVLRVATKYPNIAKKHFDKKQQRIEIIKLNGSVEIAPLLGLADVIVDIVETGNTLRANGLEVIEDILEISAKLIANKVSYRFKFKRIQHFMKRIEDRKEDVGC